MTLRIIPDIAAIIDAYSLDTIDSTILHFGEDTLLLSCLRTKFPEINRMHLMYTATAHEFNTQSWHNNCDNNGATLTIIRSLEGNVFGAFTKIEFGVDSDGKREFYDANNTILFLSSTERIQSNLSLPMIFDLKPPAQGRWQGPVKRNGSCLHSIAFGSTSRFGETSCEILIRENNTNSVELGETSSTRCVKFDYHGLNQYISGSTTHVRLKGQMQNEMAFQVVEIETFRVLFN